MAELVGSGQLGNFGVWFASARPGLGLFGRDRPVEFVCMVELVGSLGWQSRGRSGGVGLSRSGGVRYIRWGRV